jgi:hypothetical protein
MNYSCLKRDSLTRFQFVSKLLPSRYQLLVIGIVLALPTLLCAQLRDLEVIPDASPGTIPVFTEHPDRAAIIINSSIPTLQFSSTLEIVEELSEPASGRYILIIPAARQSIRISAPGYISESLNVGTISAREVRYFRVEPKSTSITETGTLIVRTNPVGARITIDGVPGTFTSPHTFEDILAQEYTVRVSLTDYEDEAVQVSVIPDRPTIKPIELIPTFGFLTVNTPKASLYLRDVGTDNEYPHTFSTGQPRRLDVGRYDYRISRVHFLDATGSFEIIPNGATTINPDLLPAYGTLRVNSNVSNFTLSAADNNAPNNPARNEINLEQGRRTVVVAAPGYVQQELEIRMQPGERIEQMITLETTAQRDERMRRADLPRGVLEISADVDAQIWVNDVLEGTGSVVLTLAPDRYRVELRHKAGRSSFQIDVPSADLLKRYVELRPARSRALTLSTILPGAGHVYRKDRRGYAYVGLFAGSVVYAYMAKSGYDTKMDDYDEALRLYRNAGSTQDAVAQWTIVQSNYQQMEDSRNGLLIAAGVVTGIYALQLLDVAITRPRYGYRGTDRAQSFAHDGSMIRKSSNRGTGIDVSGAISGTGFTIRASF